MLLFCQVWKQLMGVVVLTVGEQWGGCIRWSWKSLPGIQTGGLFSLCLGTCDFIHSCPSHLGRVWKLLPAEVHCEPIPLGVLLRWQG